MLAHYEQQTEEEAVAEDEAAFEDRNANGDGSSQGTGTGDSGTHRETPGAVRPNQPLQATAKSGRA